MDSSSSPSFCPVCGTKKRPGVAFCSGCGKSFARLCPSCGAVLKATSRFCDVCGHNLTAAGVPTPTSTSAPVPSPAPSPQGQYSADGAWWWNGTQWVSAQGPTVLTSTATAAAPEPPATKGKRGRGRKFLALAVVFAAGFVLFGFYGLFIADAAVELQLSGGAYLARPLTESTVKVYEMKSDGQPGALLATTVTDKDGHYAASVQRHPSSWLLVITSGGRYIDEISQDPLSAGPNNSLKTILRPGNNYASLTPLTTFATARASSLAASGKPLRDSFEVSYAAVARQYGLEAITDIDPAIADDPQDVQLSGRTARQYGLILAGLDEEANTLGVTDFALTDAVAQDLSDGTLDGKDGATPILIDKAVSLPADATTAKLQDAIDTFAASPGNVTHLPAPQISLQAPQIDLNTGGLSYVSPKVLPAWIDGRAATVSISGSGGTLPYTCETAGGGLPQGFSLSRDCAISGTGILGTSTMRITTPFTVRMSDASQPPQSVSFDLRITIIAEPPTITVLGGKCPKAGKACSIPVASAKGGTPPYYFTSGAFGSGMPPLGMIVNLKGQLTGTPARDGSYRFGVCVVDLVGATDCDITTVIVGEPSPPPVTPPPAQNNLPSGFPTNLTSGNYHISVCTSIPAANYNSCVDGGTFYVSSGDASALAQGLSQVADTIRSVCACTAQYTVFNGTEFDLVITDTNAGSVTRLRVTKAG